MKDNQTYFKQLQSTSQLNKREIDLVLCHVLKVNSAGLFIYSKDITKHQQQQIKQYLQQRQAGKPLAYITGYKEFWSIKLKVNQHTLIPRPETEQIVELVLKWTDKNYTGKILDLGTGTGAIALSLAKERPKAQVIAVDFSHECVEIAHQNQKSNGLDNVKIMQSDWFENIKGKFDFIVSNPPYITEDDEHLQKLSYEPITALTAKQNGLADIEHIIKNSIRYLNHDGYLILEHGYNQYQHVQKLLKQYKYIKIKTYNDLAGIPRISTARFSSL